MPQLTSHIPKLCHHKASGRGYVTIERRDLYLGTFGSAACRAEYNRLIAEWLAAGRRLPTDPQAITIVEMVAAFRRHAKGFYGSASKAAQNIDESLRPVLKLYARTAAAEFGPLRLKAVRESMIAAGRVRSNINRHISRIKSVFRWAVENELIPASVYHGLMAVRGLQAGRSGAREGCGVKPVPLGSVEPVLQFVSLQVATMIRLQILTGMRPGEVVTMRGLDIDTSGTLWAYRPQHHKNEYRGHDRVIDLGPRAQQIIAPFLKTDLAAYLFSPLDAETHRRALRHDQRKTPMNEGNRPGTNRRRSPTRKPGVAYSVPTYYRAVVRGCDAAFPPPEELFRPAKSVQLSAWRKEHRWHPHQLRHTAATELRKRHGLEAAQSILGHRSLQATQVYAERNREIAKKIMAAEG